jgi:GNAT superfamily N-acetyltransferase
MRVRITEVPPEMLAAYAGVPMAFTVDSVLAVCEVDGGLGGLALREEPVEPAYVKDYDAISPGRPLYWPQRHDVSKWGFLLALDGALAVGGAAIAIDTPGLDMLGDRRDLAVLWDLRVRPERRGQGIGTALFERSTDWAREHGCREMTIETQNTNVRACRFYAARGCRLGAIVRNAYDQPEIAHEVMLLWYLDL